MSAATVLDRRRAQAGVQDAAFVQLRAPAEEARQPRPAGAEASDDPTLEELVSALWRQVSAGGRAVCPLCAGDLEPRYAAHAIPVAGRCRACGTSIE